MGSELGGVEIDRFGVKGFGEGGEARKSKRLSDGEEGRNKVRRNFKRFSQ